MSGDEVRAFLSEAGAVTLSDPEERLVRLMTTRITSQADVAGY